MKNESAELLPDFYFGTLEEGKRLHVEAELLSDPELLLEFFDLKRSAENAATVPAEPSAALFHRLVPQANRRRWMIASLVIGAVAAALLVFAMLPKVDDSTLSNSSRILFDSGAEHSSASNVL